MNLLEFYAAHPILGIVHMGFAFASGFLVLVFLESVISIAYRERGRRPRSLYAAALAERVASVRGLDLIGHTTYADALRLLASHARATTVELEAWKRLALVAIPFPCDWYDPARSAERDAALNRLRSLGINPGTGKRFAAEEPR